MHRLARLARLDDEAAHRARALAHQMRVDGGGREQRRDRRHRLVCAAVGQDQDRRAAPDQLRCLARHHLQRLRETLFALGDGVQRRDRGGAEALAAQGAQLLELAVREDRAQRRHAAAVLRRLGEEVADRADADAQAHHQTLALGVDGWIRDLGELLLEVAREQAVAVRERGERRVVAHRADRLGAGQRHRREQQREVLARVAEDAVLEREGLLVDAHALLRAEVVEMELVLIEPLAVGALARQHALDLAVLHDAARRGVEHQHAARLEAARLDDLRLGDVEHPDLGREHADAVARAQPATGAEAVAVERGDDLVAVGRDHRRRAVPRLDERGVVLVERADVVVDVERRVAPRRRDQHRQRVLERPPRLHEKLQRGVQLGRVAPALLGDGVQLLEVAAEQLAVQLRLAGRQPVGVAAHRVDLAVVGDHVERVREVPRAERVRREARVDERERRLHVRVGEVGVVRAHLGGAQQALVDERLRGHAGDRELGVGDAGGADGLLDAAANHVELALERIERAVAAFDDQLAHERCGLARDGADRLGHDGHLAPADGAVTLLGDGAHRDLGAAQTRARIVGEEDHPDAEVAGGRQVDALLARDAREEAVRHLDEDAGAVARLRIGAGRAAMVEALEDGQRLLDDGMGGDAIQVHDGSEAAGIVLELPVVETAGVLRVPHGSAVYSICRRRRIINQTTMNHMVQDILDPYPGCP